MAGYSVFPHADTEVDYCFIVEDNICRLIINVEPELKKIKVLLPIALPSSPAIANTFVSASAINFSCPTFRLKNQVRPLKTQIENRHSGAVNVRH